MSELVKRAELFARAAHATQKRKYTAEPYIVHPEAVAALVAGVGGSEEMIAAAWLHDTVEDTSATIEDIRSQFGSAVAALVSQLTDVSSPADGNRARRKELDRQHLATASPAAKTIKLADLLDNSKSILKHDPEFAAVYLDEKRALLDVLTEGDPSLWRMAGHTVKQSASQ